MTDENIKHYWAEIVKDTRASIKDVAELGKTLNFPIKVKTITGEILYESKNKSKGALIEIVDYDAHLWTIAVKVFPRTRRVILYNDDIVHFINEMSKNDPVSVWLFSFENEFD